MGLFNKACFVGGAAVIAIGINGGIELGGGKTNLPPSGEEDYVATAGGIDYSSSPPSGTTTTNSSGVPNNYTGGANADPNGMQTGNFRGDADAAERLIGTYNVGYDENINGWCARGVSKILEAYCGMPITSTSGANAKYMGPILTNKFGMTAVADTGVYQNGDTRVLQNSGAGHIETYMNGRWVSDFVQNGPSTGSSRYTGSQLYRFL